MSKRDLLRKLRSVRSTERGIVPDQAWVLRTRARLMEQIHEADALSPLPASLRFREAARAVVPARVVQWMRAPVLAGMAAVVAVLGGSLVSVSASERSVPGDFLYPVKIVGEQTRLALTQGKADRVRLKAEFVDRRVEEIKTIVKTPEKKTSDRVREAAIGLKRDLDTVKNQLKEVKDEASAPETAELAKLVDRKTEQVSQELKQVKTEVSEDQGAKQAVVDAEAQAVQTSVAAVAVLIEAKSAPDAQDVVSDEEVTQVLNNKVQNLRASLDGSAVQLMTKDSAEQATSEKTSSTSSSVTTSSTVPELATANASLSEVQVLLGEQKLNEATTKLAEAAKATVIAVAAVDQLVASSTSMTASGSETSSSTGTTSSTLETVRGSTSTDSGTPSPP